MDLLEIERKKIVQKYITKPLSSLLLKFAWNTGTIKVKISWFLTFYHISSMKIYLKQMQQKAIIRVIYDRMQQAYPAECFIIFKWIYRLLESKNEAEVKQGLELQFECAPLSKSKNKNEAAYSSVQIANCSSEEIVAINSTESFVKIQRSRQYTSSASDS